MYQGETTLDRRVIAMQVLERLNSESLQKLVMDRFDQEIRRARLLLTAAAGAIEIQLRETLLQGVEGIVPESTKPRRRYRRWGASYDEIRLKVFSTMADDPRARYRLRDLPTSAWRFIGKGDRALWPDMDALNTDYAKWRSGIQAERNSQHRLNP